MNKGLVMKLVKTSSGKTRIKMSRSEWMRLGKRAGWTSSSADVVVKESAIINKPSKRLSDIFGPDGKIAQEVAKTINSNVGAISNFMSQTYPDVKVLKYFIAGASVTYQYDESSDVDVSVILNISEKDPRYKEIDKWIEQNVANKFFYKKRPYEFKARGKELLNFLDNVDSAYDVQNQRWMKKPDYQISKEERSKRVAPNSEAHRDFVREEKSIISALISLVKVGTKALMDPSKLEHSIGKWLTPQIEELLATYQTIKKERKEAYQLDPQQKGLVSQNWGRTNIIYKLLEDENYINYFSNIKSTLADNIVDKNELQGLVEKAKALLQEQNVSVASDGSWKIVESQSSLPTKTSSEETNTTEDIMIYFRTDDYLDISGSSKPAQQ